MRAQADIPPNPEPDPGQAVVMGIVQAYLAASRETQSIEAQRRLLRQACTRLRTNFRHEEESWPGSATALEARQRM
jgi:hypothetical protein